MSGLDITPRVAEGRQLIQAYGGGGFKVAGTRYEGSILVFPEETLKWPVQTIDDITIDSLSAVADRAVDLEILIIGCGGGFQPPPKGLREALKEKGLVLEWMDTGAACRTHSVLITEERRAAAAVIAID